MTEVICNGVLCAGLTQTSSKKSIAVVTLPLVSSFAGDWQWVVWCGVPSSPHRQPRDGGHKEGSAG